MAISYTVSYTFSPSTTIASSQVNTNFSDNANTWVGLEAKTKTFSNLGVDTELKSGGTVKSADGTLSAPGFTFTSNTALGIYLSGSNLGLIGLNAWGYRRPVLQYSSGTVVNLETGANGTSGQAAVLFPDGQLRTDSTTSRINCNMAQNAVLSGTAQSGLRTGSQTANTWYSFYAVKVTDSTTNFVTVADTVLPLQANYATLNSNFGTSGWVFLGTLANGDNSGATNVILKFSQTGNFIQFRNITVGNGTQGGGIRLVTNAVAGSPLTFTYAAGTNIATPSLPNQISMGVVVAGHNNTTPAITFLLDSGANIRYVVNASIAAGAAYQVTATMALLDGIQIISNAANKHDIYLMGYWDGVLGVGANPIL